jgi:C4-dicarboxylate-specific signal transduction histidine kinase
LSWLHVFANAPIFSYDDSFFVRELVGGPMLSVLQGSRETAAVAMRILGGEKAGDINPPVVEFAKPKFDWREMQRWGISESRLPPGSEVLFRQPTVWELYRLQILAAFAAFLVQAALIAWLVYEQWRRHNAEVKVRHALTELAHMNRAATVGEMTASIAHEIRQPLAAVTVAGHTALNWLKRQVPDVEEARVALQNVIQEAHRADDVIENIRAMFKKEEAPRATVDVNDLIEHVLVLAKTTIDSNDIVLETDLMDSPRPLVRGDAIQLQQVLLNLINNAVEAMASSDRARVLQIKTDTSSIQVALVTVADSGPGIDPKIADRLFEPFVTTKAGGMGMGLSICKSIIEAHGGKLTTGPAKPFGTLFVVSLPIWQP